MTDFWLFASLTVLALAVMSAAWWATSDGDPPHSGSVGGPFVFPCR